MTPVAGPAAASMVVVMVRQSSECSWSSFFLTDSRLGGLGSGVIVPVGERGGAGLLPLTEEGSSAGTMSHYPVRGMPSDCGMRGGWFGEVGAGQSGGKLGCVVFLGLGEFFFP